MWARPTNRGSFLSFFVDVWQYMVMLSVASIAADFVLASISPNRDVYKDAKLEFLNESGVQVCLYTQPIQRPRPTCPPA